MSTFKEYIEEQKIVDYYTVYPYEEVECIPDYELTKKQGYLQPIRVETYGVNGDCEKQVLLYRHWRTGKFYIQLNVFNAHWKNLKEGLANPDSHVKLKCLAKKGRSIEFKNNTISFESVKASSSSWIKNCRRRDSILENSKLIFIHSKANYTVHDKSCKLLKDIPDEYILGSSSMPKDHIVCEECSKKLYLRMMIGQDGKRIDNYQSFLDRAGADYEIIRRFANVYKAELYLENHNILRISCNMDSWQIIIDNSGAFRQLRHNNYFMTDNGTRYITGAYHAQKGEFSNINEAFNYICTYSFEAHLADDQKRGLLVNRTERKDIFAVYRKVEIEYYVQQGLTHEFVECGYIRRKEAQTRLLEAAGIDVSESKYAESMGSLELSKDIVEGMKLFTEYVLSKKEYKPKLISRRILIQLGIQEKVKPIITSNIKALGAYLCKDTAKGRKGYSPKIIQEVFDCINGRENFQVIGLEDLRYLIQIGYKDNLVTEVERDGAIQRGIKIITSEDYLPIGKSPFIAAYISGRISSIVYSQLLKYMESNIEERLKFDEVFSQFCS